MPIRGTFFKSIGLTVINEYDKGDVMQIWTVLGHVCHADCRRVLSNGTFFLTTFSEFLISELQKLWGSSFFTKVWNFSWNSKKQQKIEKKFFISEIIASELWSLNCLYEEQDTFPRKPMCLEEVPRFFTQIRETFSNFIELVVIYESDKRWCDADLKSAWVRLPCCFSKDPLKRDFSSNHVFGVRKIGNTKAVRVLFFFKTFKISARLQTIR